MPGPDRFNNDQVQDPTYNSSMTLEFMTGQGHSFGQWHQEIARHMTHPALSFKLPLTGSDLKLHNLHNVLLH